VERFNRILKTRMWRYFSHQNSYRWVDVLQSLVSAYNKAFHRAIQMPPKEVDKDNEMDLWMQKEPLMFKLPLTKTTVLLGDHVRLSKVKHVFAKGYLPSWTEEVFTVSRILNTSPVQVRVKDYNSDEIDGSFYLHEIQLVDKPETYRVEKILQQKTVSGIKQYLVKWLGYSDHFNSWVTQDQIK
jgi:hypothetical protein